MIIRIKVIIITMAASSDPKVWVLGAQRRVSFGPPRDLFLGSGCYIRERKDLFSGGMSVEVSKSQMLLASYPSLCLAGPVAPLQGTAFQLD